VAQLRALGGIAVAGDLDEEGGHGGAKTRLEEEIQNLAALRFGIILQQNGGGAATAHRADAIEDFSPGAAVESDDLIRRGRQTGESAQAKCDYDGERRVEKILTRGLDRGMIIHGRDWL